MGLVEYILDDSIFIDFGSDYMYGSDQVCLDHPCRFATVEFQLIPTAFLDGIVDRIRKEAGFTPFHAVDEYTDEMCDPDGWYDFYFMLADFGPAKTGTCIEAVVCNSRSSDEGEMYTIDLTRGEQEMIYRCLDRQCRKYLDKGCDDLLSEARKEMEEDYGHEP